MINDDVQLNNMVVTNKLMNYHSKRMHELCNIHTREKRATIPFGHIDLLFCVSLCIFEFQFVIPLCFCLSTFRFFFDIGTCYCYFHRSPIFWCIFEHFSYLYFVEKVRGGELHAKRFILLPIQKIKHIILNSEMMFIFVCIQHMYEYSRWASGACTFIQTYVPIFPSHILKLNELTVSCACVHCTSRAHICALHVHKYTHGWWNNGEYTQQK